MHPSLMLSVKINTADADFVEREISKSSKGGPT